MNDTADEATEIFIEPPTEPGWYAYDEGRQTLIFHLDEHGRWMTFSSNGGSAQCDWGYIEQALSVYNLVPLIPSAYSLREVWKQGYEAGDMHSDGCDYVYRDELDDSDNPYAPKS